MSDTKYKSFPERIRAMNEMYALEINDSPRFVANPLTRIRQIRQVLIDEVSEADDIIQGMVVNTPAIDLLAEIADWLADMVVYIRSEALRWGIPLEDVLDIVMDSNESKLDADGKPIMSPDGSKFLKGPNYWKPEPKIKELLLSRIRESGAYFNPDPAHAADPFTKPGGQQ